MDIQDIIKKAIEDAMFLLNDEFESVINKETAKRYEDVLKDLEKGLNLLPKLIQKRNKWTDSLN